MKPFVFKLQTALGVKYREEDLQKEELYRAAKVYRQRVEYLEILRNRFAELQEMVRHQQAKVINVVEIKTCLDFIPVHSEKIIQQEISIEESRVIMDNARAKLIETMRKRKILEKLKNRHYQDYLKEALREEQKQIDEMATISYIRKDSAV